MKRKTLFKRLSSAAMALLLSLSALTQGITASAFSSTNKATQEWLNEWSYDFRGSGLPNGYDIETGKSNDTHFTGYWASSVPYFSTSDGSYAYCINFDKLHTNGTTSKQQTLADYVKGAHVPDSMQRQIKEFCIYSYKGKTQYGYSKDTEICASSIMAQAVSARYYDGSSASLSSNETKLLNAYSYNGSNASAHHKDLVDCYKKMKAEMVSHYDIPSGTSVNSNRTPTYKAKYDVKTGKWTATVKLDSTLSQFSISKPNAVTSQKSGSQVILTADNEKDLKNVVFTLTKTKGKYVDHIDECSPLILSGGSDVQEMVVSCYEDKDPVQAYFKLKIDMPTGNADLEKNFIDFFGNEETNVADKLKAVKFNLVMKNGDSDLFIKATGSNGKYTFSSTVAQANATDMTLDADGNIHVSGLPQGSYYWKETTTANGYALKTKTDVTVEADKTSKTVVDNQRTSVDKGELVIYKTDESGKKYLSGAKFEITAAEDIVVSGGITIRKKGDIIDTVTTDENGKAVITKDIYQGYSYTVTEIEAPKGYSLNSEPQTVKIATDTADFGSEVSVKNSPWTAPFIITKKNLGGELLPNCEFEILDENKRQITTGITDENGIATFSLGYGKYFYHEIAAPEEYIIDDTLYPFEITEEGVSVYAEMTNYLKEGSIKVTKTTTGNLNVKDIGFIVKGISDTNSDIERELFTDENGEALFENLPIGKYTVTEDGSTVPAAYIVADEQEVTVEYNETAEVAFENIEKTGSIKVQKRTEGQKNVEGITFYLKGTSDTGREINIPATTNKDGIAVFENVPIGTYSIIEDEETVPYGYLVADEKEVTVIYAETVDAEILNNEQTGTIKVHKRTEGDLNISGITFYLKGTSDTGREINIPATTDKDGVAVFENVPVGTYKIIEDKETVPYGYLVADEKEVKVEYAQTIDATILNNEQTGSIKVHKKTADMTNVEGIRFILSGVSDTGREIRIEAVTDKDGLAKFEGVPVGTYTITEDGSTVPYGYLVADSKQVTVAYAQTVDTDMVNEKAPDTPNTGSSDNDIDGRTVLGGVVVILAGAAIVMFSRKRKER
ncbi:MAG: SpaA isopeptide-forming pilin-related protein [Ruminococcus bicirculans (ex Wegman et al. 2014)]|uniref:SpaA isopeptide-forming pilin-related protein n=1 Tax=Ruminococcus bicirculans (ex Wegman et al. 2014) TaxID=1160721 RepID=UPI003994E296